jgi:hypothetical protein
LQSSAHLSLKLGHFPTDNRHSIHLDDLCLYKEALSFLFILDALHQEILYVDHVRDIACTFISPPSDLIRHIPATSAVKHRNTELPFRELTEKAILCWNRCGACMTTSECRLHLKADFTGPAIIQPGTSMSMTQRTFSPYSDLFDCACHVRCGVTPLRGELDPPREIAFQHAGRAELLQSPQKFCSL